MHQNVIDVLLLHDYSYRKADIILALATALLLLVLLVLESLDLFGVCFIKYVLLA